MELPRQPGSRENRWIQLLSGVPAIDERTIASPGADVTVGEIAALKANVAKLEAEVNELRTMTEKMYSELGIQAGN